MYPFLNEHALLSGVVFGRGFCVLKFDFLWFAHLLIFSGRAFCLLNFDFLWFAQSKDDFLDLYGKGCD